MRDWEQHIRARCALPDLEADRERRIVAELAAQFEDCYQEALAEGLTSEQAEARVRSQIPDWTAFVAELKEANRPYREKPLDRWAERAAAVEFRGSAWTRGCAALGKDLILALRFFRARPGFGAVALLTLALGLGVNTAIFSLLNAVLLKPLPYPEPDRIVRVLQAGPNGRGNIVSTLNYLDWQAQNQVFESMAATAPASVTLTGVQEPVQIPGSLVSARFFEVLGVRPVLGRGFLPGEDQAGGNRVVVLSHALWRSRFGGDASLLGRALVLDGEPHTVVGILPEGTPLERGTARLWRPLVFTPANLSRDFNWLVPVARLRRGVTLDQARLQMAALAARIARANGIPAQGQAGIRVDRYSDTLVRGDLRQSLYVLLGAVGAVLLIACANLANLFLMRMVGREREVALRLALGASRGALLRQFLAESLLVALAGGVLGLLVGRLALAGLQAMMPAGYLPPHAVVDLDGRVLAFAFLLAGLTGLLIGILPALRAARPGLVAALHQGSLDSGSGSAQARLRAGLVVAEVALAFALLSGAGLLLRSLQKLHGVDPGFVSENVLTFGLPVSPSRYADPQALGTYVQQVEARLRSLPGVGDVATTSALPLQGWGIRMPFRLAHRRAADTGTRMLSGFKMVSPSYFRTLGMRFLRGRALADSDRRGTTPVAVINEALARMYFPGEDPIGKHVCTGRVVPNATKLGEEVSWEVVGVVASERVGGLDDGPDDPGMYVPNDQSPEYNPFVLVRGTHGTGPLRTAIRRAVSGINGDQVLPDMMTLDEIKGESLEDSRFRATLLAAFAALSLLLSCLGIYGVVSCSVTHRTRELGIRAALGADRAGLLRLVLGRGMALAGLGLMVGLLGAMGLGRWLASLLYGISGRDPLTLLLVAVLLALVALAACLVPALRATRADPLTALRCE